MTTDALTAIKAALDDLAIYVPLVSVTELRKPGSHCAVSTMIHNKQLKSGNGIAFYAIDPSTISALISSYEEMERRVPAGDGGDITYEVMMKDGDWCAESTSFADAQHYAAMYGQDGPVEIIEVRRRTLSPSGEAK